MALPDISAVLAHPRFRRRGEFSNWGEQIVAARLDRALRAYRDEESIVLCNPIITNRDGKERQEVDFVVITPMGVAVIEVKHWSARTIRFDGQGRCLRDGREERSDPRRQPELAPKRLAGYLQTQGLPFRAAVNGLLLFARDDHQLLGDLDMVVPVRSLSQGIDEVVSGVLFRARRQGDRLSTAEIRRVADAIWGGQPDRCVPVVGDYELRDHLPARYRETFLAYPLADSGLPGGPVRMVRHAVGYTESRVEWERRVVAARRDYDALVRLAKIPGIPVQRGFFSDPGDDSFFWTAYQHVPGQSLAALGPPTTTDELHRRIGLLSGVAEILAGCHEEGVVHRGLSPDCLYVEERGGRPWILCWDLSRIEGMQTVGSQAAAQLRGSRYVAPELRVDPHQATAAADGYSLGVILIEQVTREPLESSDPETAAARIQASCWPHRELADLACRLVSRAPLERLAGSSIQHRVGLAEIGRCLRRHAAPAGS